MTDKRVYMYEGMFLFSQATASDFGGMIAHLNEVLQRGHAEVVAMQKWDERRLAYEIDGQKRGVYILVYFRAPGTDVAHIERDCNLSERIMRAQILRADHLSEEEIFAKDGRKDLEVEAKLRAERAATQQAVTAGAPTASSESDEGEAEGGEDAENN